MVRRLARVCALALVLALAGCTKEEGSTPPPASPTPEPTPSPTPEASPQPTPTPTPSPTPSPTPTPTPTPTPASTPPPTPTPAGTPFFLNVSHDYAQPGETQTFSIPAGTVELEIRLDFTPASTPLGGVCAGAGRIVVKRPDATVYDDGTMGPGTGDPATTHCPVNRATTTTGLGGAVVAGTWSVEFSGQGQGFGHVQVKPAA